MAIDLSRVATKALEAALEDGGSPRRGSTTRAMAAGAVLAVGAKAAISRGPGVLRHLPALAELRDIPDRIRDRMADAGWLDDEPDVDEPEDAAYEDEPEPEELDEDEEPDEEEDEDDEPEAEADEDFDEDEDLDDEDDDEDLDEPESEAGEDFDEDDEYEPAPELELESEDDENVHPEDRPPKPPRSKASSGR